MRKLFYVVSVFSMVFSAHSKTNDDLVLHYYNGHSGKTSLESFLISSSKESAEYLIKYVTRKETKNKTIKKEFVDDFRVPITKIVFENKTKKITCSSSQRYARIVDSLSNVSVDVCLNQTKNVATIRDILVRFKKQFDSY